MITKRNWLRDLHVGKAGQDGAGVLFGQIQQSGAQDVQLAVDVIDRRAGGPQHSAGR